MKRKKGQRIHKSEKKNRDGGHRHTGRVDLRPAGATDARRALLLLPVAVLRCAAPAPGTTLGRLAAPPDALPACGSATEGRRAACFAPNATGNGSANPLWPLLPAATAVRRTAAFPAAGLFSAPLRGTRVGRARSGTTDGRRTADSARDAGTTLGRRARCSGGAAVAALAAPVEAEGGGAASAGGGGWAFSRAVERSWGGRKKTEWRRWRRNFCTIMLWRSRSLTGACAGTPTGATNADSVCVLAGGSTVVAVVVGAVAGSAAGAGTGVGAAASGTAGTTGGGSAQSRASCTRLLLVTGAHSAVISTDAAVGTAGGAEGAMDGRRKTNRCDGSRSAGARASSAALVCGTVERRTAARRSEWAGSGAAGTRGSLNGWLSNLKCRLAGGWPRCGASACGSGSTSTSAAAEWDATAGTETGGGTEAGCALCTAAAGGAAGTGAPTGAVVVATTPPAAAATF